MPGIAGPTTPTAGVAQPLVRLQESMGIITWVWDIAAGRTTWYGDLAPMLGLPAGSFQGQFGDWLRQVHPDDTERSRRRFIACLKGTLPVYRAEERALHANGSLRWLETCGRGVYGADGRATQLVGVVRDITEQKLAEQAIVDSERRLRALIEAAPVAIGMSRGDQVSDCNTSFLALFGAHSVAQLIGRPVLDLVAPASQAGFLERSRRRSAGEPVEAAYEMTARRLDGSLFDCQISVGDAALATGGATLVFVQDISERLRAEQAVRALNASLEARVAERTAALEASITALADARDAAQAATRAKGEFLANMSHEIRTPMNAILGLADLALRVPGLPPRATTYVRNVHRAGASLLGILNDILDFSKIEAGKLHITHDVFSLDDVLDRVSTFTAVKAADKGLALQLDCAPEVPRRLVGDAMRLGQVLLNLCSNAVKFTARGEVVVSVRTVQQQADRVTLRFAVRDTGIGIAADQLGRLFQPFDQLDGSITRQHGGTGLGLAICHQLVGLLGGEIGVHSQPGEGSTFHATLPFGCPAHDDAAPADRAPGAMAVPAETPAEVPAEVPAAIAGRRVLLVEDNELNQIVAVDLLADVAGAVVTVATDGQTALDRLAAEPFDLVLMDVQMPGLDGYEATRRLRRDPRHAALPVVAMTAHAMPRDRALAQDAGMNDFITKPFEPSALFDTVARWLPPLPPRAAAAADPVADTSVLDLGDGLRRCLGRSDLYARILQRFAETRADDVLRLQAAAARGDRAAIGATLHVLMTSAGMVGALPLSVQARALHAQLDHGLPADDALAQLCDMHRRVLAAVAAASVQAGAATAASPSLA
jgi:PAS domain S-box-containing protein